MFAYVSDQILGRGLFNVHIDSDLAAGQIQSLVECGNLGAGELRPRFDARVQRAHFVKSHFRNFTLTSSTTVHLAVVAQYQLSISSRADVHFDEIGAEPDGLLKRRNGIFWMVQMLASMGNGDDLPWLALGHKCQ